MSVFTPEEHKLFQEALEKYGDGASGTEWANIVAHCRKTELEARAAALRVCEALVRPLRDRDPARSRHAPQVKLHAQRYLVALQHTCDPERQSTLDFEANALEWTQPEDAIFEKALADNADGAPSTRASAPARRPRSLSRPPPVPARLTVSAPHARSDDPERWEKIAALLPDKTAKDIDLRCEAARRRGSLTREPATHHPRVFSPRSPSARTAHAFRSRIAHGRARAGTKSCTGMWRG